MYGRNTDSKPAPPQKSISWALFGLRGRISRATYLWGLASMLSVLVVITVLIVKTPEESALFAGWGLMFIFAGLLATWALFALSLKRIHDIGWPTPLIILLFLPPTSFLFFVAMAVVKGSKEHNDHGAPPFG